MVKYTKMSLAYGEHTARIEDFYGAPQVVRALGNLVAKVVRSSGLDVERHASGWIGIDFASAQELDAKVRREAVVQGPKALPIDIERAKAALASWR